MVVVRFKLVDRSGEQLGPTGWLDLQAGALVATFLSVLGSPSMYNDANLNGVSIYCLKVYGDQKAYEDPQQGPLQVEDAIGDLGCNLPMPSLWKFHESVPDTDVDWVPLADENNAQDLRKAVFAILPRALRDNLEAESLRVFANDAVYQQRNATPLGSRDSLSGLGNSAANALIVEVPRVWYKLVDADTGDTFPQTDVNWVLLADENNPRGLRNAVFAKVGSVLPENVIADNLRVYGTETVSNQEKRTLLGSRDSLAGFGRHAVNPVIVEVPRPKKRVKLTNSSPPTVDWSTAESRFHLSIPDTEELIVMPPECFGGAGIGEDKKAMVLYRRQELVNEWNEIERCCIRTYSHLWIHGPPGTGKSCAALAYACSLDPSEWDVLWIHSSRKFGGSTACGCKSYLPQMLDAASIARGSRPAVDKTNFEEEIGGTIVFLDGYVSNDDVMDRALEICIEWQDNDKARRRLVSVTSMAKVGKGYQLPDCRKIPVVFPERQASTDQLEPMDTSEQRLTDPDARPMWSHSLFKLYSWTLEDYEKAVSHDTFFESIETKKKSTRKVFRGRRSARVMFDYELLDATRYLQVAISAVTDIEMCSKVLTGNAATGTINRLVAMYSRTGRDESQLVSRYVMGALAIRLGPDLLKSFAKLNGVVPSVDGYMFKAWLFSELTHNGVRWQLPDAEPEQWELSTVNYFNPACHLGQLNYKGQYQDQTWLAPLKWNEAGYDAVFVDKSKLVLLVQVTRAQTPSNLHCYAFVEVLNKLAAEKELMPFRKIEMCFVVPECNLTRLQRKHLAVAGPPERVTRSSSPSTVLPFEPCLVDVKVVSVEYDPTHNRPVKLNRHAKSGVVREEMDSTVLHIASIDW
ncbi:hypothetical protein PHYSODRAFT_306597 [Phytophthora sojae]|uniref:Uncharacterized protein n=1 Tax=Phytophthora sojae (strain P6497) TaxID=1094619 RepID=G5A9Y6_PHYSP|nr:hypothetical protein PHYSODRAFT_306597 [Phytophthora sojae]EGZ07416.1 hypothetical protein PHYSODRAFT_306597 [Phytophthora sojae]|eukprot:XP_009536982.1 hypothetical protein PHYSODRAFT_306597 [Phytophthora sojae]